MSIQEGLELKEHGQNVVECNNKEFIDTMRRYASMRYKVGNHHQSQSIEMTIDDLREYAEAMQLAPNSPNAWGAIFKKAPDGFKFVNTGRTIHSKFKSNHGRRIYIFEVKRDQSNQTN